MLLGIKTTWKNLNNKAILLKSKYKQMLLDIFSELTLPVEVWAYGSRVSGTAHDGSDLDLVIRSMDGKKLPIDILMELKEKIRDSNVPILVDLFDWARLPESFHQNIETCHEVFFPVPENIPNQ
jgi:predicted nucleotidyltransferase